MIRKLNFSGSEPILYMVATPIGNLKEFSPRAMEILNEMDAIACEDTRETKKLLRLVGIDKPLIACHEHNEKSASETIVGLILSGQKIAYVSDAGYPGISDPGHRLIVSALEKEIKISVISGPSAVLNALIGSGLPSEQFYFHGFLLNKEAARLSELQALYNRKETLIFYESPHRIDDTLKNMVEVFGNRKACIARELTKLHEEFIRGTLGELSEIDPTTLKGEMVIIVSGNDDEMSVKMSDEEIQQLISQLTQTGMSMKDAIRHVALSLKLSKNYIYKLVHRN
jgi:16S rRNA (cytidine1402-2'-O)-methyltransferase